MKQHKFWAYAMVFCAVMAVWTGRKHALAPSWKLGSAHATDACPPAMSRRGAGVRFPL